MQDMKTSDLKGMFPKLGSKVSIDDMNAAIAKRGVVLSQEHPETAVKHIVRGIVRRGLQPLPSKASISLRVD